MGLLLLAVRAATSLSEERIRGSLDVLMSTPMSTASILAGKWWGSFRLVPYLIVFPVLIGAAWCFQSGMWGSLILFVMLFLGYGAAVTSVGLVVSIWVVRQSRVLALVVGLYVAACIFWIVVGATMFPRAGNAVALVGIGSPLGGPVFSTLALMGEQFRGPASLKDEIFPWLFGWNVFYWLLAMILFKVSCRTFDDRLGRVPDFSLVDPSEKGLRVLLPRFRRASIENSPPPRGASEPV